MASAVIVPAAGKGERFGGAKLLARIDGDTMLGRTLRSLLNAGVGEVVVVTAPDAVFDEVALLKDPRVRVVKNPDPSRGMFSSIQIGIREASGDPLAVLPADMPFVSSYVIAAVIDACARTHHIVVPAHLGKRGHPVAFPAELRHAILAADAQSTLKAALAGTMAYHFELDVDDSGVLRDVDVRQDL
jgi:molybdenum cofactor cytidylyltransferase